MIFKENVLWIETWAIAWLWLGCTCINHTLRIRSLQRSRYYMLSRHTQDNSTREYWTCLNHCLSHCRRHIEPSLSNLHCEYIVFVPQATLPSPPDFEVFVEVIVPSLSCAQTKTDKINIVSCHLPVLSFWTQLLARFKLTLFVRSFLVCFVILFVSFCMFASFSYTNISLLLFELPFMFSFLFVQTVQLLLCTNTYI